jgi:hypothetical protein
MSGASAAAGCTLYSSCFPFKCKFVCILVSINFSPQNRASLAGQACDGCCTPIGTAPVEIVERRSMEGMHRITTDVIAAAQQDATLPSLMERLYALAARGKVLFAHPVYTEAQADFQLEAANAMLERCNELARVCPQHSCQAVMINAIGAEKSNIFSVHQPAGCHRRPPDSAAGHPGQLDAGRRAGLLQPRQVTVLFLFICCCCCCHCCDRSLTWQVDQENAMAGGALKDINSARLKESRRKSLNWRSRKSKQPPHPLLRLSPRCRPHLLLRLSREATAFAFFSKNCQV